MGVKPCPPAGIGILPQNTAGFISSAPLGISLELQKPSLTWALCTHTGTHYSFHLGWNSSTPSSLLSLFSEICSFFKPTWFFSLRISAPPHHYVRYVLGYMFPCLFLPPLLRSKFRRWPWLSTKPTVVLCTQWSSPPSLVWSLFWATHSPHSLQP